MFIAGMSAIAEPPFNDLWTVPGEEDLLPAYQKEDREAFLSVDSETYYHTLQLRDFILSIIEQREPLVPITEGRRAVELFTAIYRSQETGQPVKFPLK